MQIAETYITAAVNIGSATIIGPVTEELITKQYLRQN